mmetsp:Transcript_6630/g.24727  ORF Transcript_6630/g.24727 Transcript_6630/m.24727 type:complete len:249 (-) Transcript_6630:2184-2930(-)
MPQTKPEGIPAGHPAFSPKPPAGRPWHPPRRGRAATAPRGSEARRQSTCARRPRGGRADLQLWKGAVRRLRGWSAPDYDSRTAHQEPPSTCPPSRVRCRGGPRRHAPEARAAARAQRAPCEVSGVPSCRLFGSSRNSCNRRGSARARPSDPTQCPAASAPRATSASPACVCRHPRPRPSPKIADVQARLWHEHRGPPSQTAIRLHVRLPNRPRRAPSNPIGLPSSHGDHGLPSRIASPERACHESQET